MWKMGLFFWIDQIEKLSRGGLELAGVEGAEDQAGEFYCIVNGRDYRRFFSTLLQKCGMATTDIWPTDNLEAGLGGGA